MGVSSNVVRRARLLPSLVSLFSLACGVPLFDQGALAASVRAARSRSKPTLACSPRVPSRAGNDRPRESGRPPRSKARSSFGTPQAQQARNFVFSLPERARPVEFLIRDNDGKFK